MKFEINPWLSHTINVIGLFILIGGAIYITKSSWCLLGLAFAPSMSTKN